MFNIFMYPLDKMIEKVYNKSKLKITSLKQILQKPLNNKIMKNLIFSLVLGIVLISCNSCHDDYNPPVPPVVVKYTVEAKNDSAIGGTITPSSVTVNSGSDVTLTITPDFGCLVKELKVNGTVVTLTTPTTYILKNVTADTKAVVTFKKTLNWYLTQKPWMFDSIMYYCKSGDIYNSTFTKSKIMYVYLSDGSVKNSSNAAPLGSIGHWSLDETQKPNILFDSYMINITEGYKKEIQQLDENVMIVKVLNDYSLTHPFVDGDPVVKVLNYYSHPK